MAGAYPQVRLVYGTIDDANLIEDEASKADMVFHAATSDEHVTSAQAIIRGLARRQADGPGYYIHTSGALSMGAESISTGRYGDRFDKVWDDWEHYGELIGMPESVPHGKVDKLVLAASSGSNGKIKTAMLAPPAIYGKGRGPDKTRSIALFDTFLRRGKVFGVGKGENIWSNVHVQDLSNLFLLLAESAVNGGSPAEGWDEGGYYLAENGSYVAKEMLQLGAQLAHKKGLLPTAEVDLLTSEEADKILPYASIVLGVNVRCSSIRAKKLLGWEPTMPSFEDVLTHSLDVDARHAGLL